MLTHRSVESGFIAASNCARGSLFGAGGGSACTPFSTGGAGLGWLLALMAVCALAAIAIGWLLGQRRRLHARLEDPREQASRALAFHAYHDTLTGLPNRAFIMRELEQALASPDGDSLAVMFIDLDGFKSINDTLGHEAGDVFLRAVASSLRSSVRARDTVSRFGGDEFVVVVQAYGGIENLVRVCRKVLDLVSKPVSVSGQLVAVSPSIGVAVAPKDGQQASTLIRNADAAMYAVKETGKADFRFYEEGMLELARERLALTVDLREALQAGQLSVEYQPKRNLRDGSLAGVEALARWHHPTRGDVPPSVFVAIAERSGLIHALGEYVLRSVLNQVLAWDASGTVVDYVAINLSMHELSRPAFVDTLHRAVRSYGVDPTRIRFELTESTAMRQPEETMRQLVKLRSHGFDLLIDDFGAGYWNLSHLRELPVGTIKIDQSFVRGSTLNLADREITEAIVGLAKKLNMRTIAEGVETEAQADWLRDLGCDIGQGYFFARPMTADAFTRYLDPTVAYAG
ncbi:MULTISPECIES: EAL domain-containing protein [unclassified Luteibacter]|uniref:putative bifunctional diguanylate cyclase/phosphodiesterase n=1 Tax=unclassified Luteibacter TaxID=2620188 RepID=UPI0008CF9266|nr:MULTISPECIES: EAL domain-containing protein [unclassified Luteibacter]MDR6936066.1 diguanylate cyclase (GGDEF)-like protein [Luteibacter sp. 3190]SEV89031.1 diguanylate cyclase (GGDEF) domain-containing protein [Luteibacter sp. 329MFSha]